MSIKRLIKAEQDKIMTEYDLEKKSIRVGWLLLWRLVSLSINLLKSRYYLRKCTLTGLIAFTFSKPKIINRGTIRIGNIIRIVSTINQVLIDVAKGGELTIGDNCRLNGCNISVHTKVMIGNNCRIAPHSIIMDGDHHNVANRLMKGKSQPIIIEDDVWLATRTMVLKGVRIGKGAVIASGAVVTKDIPSYSLAAGIPAKVIRKISSSDIPT